MKQRLNKKIFFFQDFQAMQVGEGVVFFDSYVLFLTELGSIFQSFVISARLRETDARVSGRGIVVEANRVFELRYSGIRGLLLRPFRFLKVCLGISKESRKYDILYLAWPHPISLFLALRYRGRKNFVFVVRQNMLAIVNSKYGRMEKLSVVAVLKVMEFLHRRLFKKNLLFAYGSEMFVHYTGAGYTHVVSIRDSLLKKDQIARKAKSHPVQRNLLYVGRLEKEKGCAQLLIAFSRFIRKRPLATLTIVGSGSEDGNLKELAVQLGVSENVSFKGFIPMGDELLGFYREHSCLVLPSYSEGFPKVIDEARAFGLPTIASDVGGIRELEHVESGVYKVPDNTPCSLEDGLTEVLNDRELYQRLSRNAARSCSLEDSTHWAAAVAMSLNRFVRLPAQPTRRGETDRLARLTMRR